MEPLIKGSIYIYLAIHSAAMPRGPRVAVGGLVYHVINRANGKLRIFKKDEDFLAFYEVLQRTLERHPMDIFSWCVMNNHWHFVVRPKHDGDLSQFFGYLTLRHAVRWETAHGAIGIGHVYQGRFRSFIIQEDEHLRTVMRYVERNPLRAKLTQRAEDWRWSSLHALQHADDPGRAFLSESPIDRGRDWIKQVNAPQTEAELSAIATCMQRNRPLGDERWTKRMADKHDLHSTIRPRGRQVGWRKKK
jgi:putative transposase